jgi:RNA polymerase sigma-70 factor (ECF subfamily)
LSGFPLERLQAPDAGNRGSARALRCKPMTEAGSHDAGTRDAGRRDDGARDRVSEALLAKAARGDSDAWRALVSAFAPRVHGLLVAQCRNDELAEEITQSVFCTVAVKLADYVESGRFEAWLFRIAMNRLRDEMRRRARQARPTDDAPMRELPARASHRTTAAELEIHQKLRRAMDQLSEEDREIIELRHTGGMSFRALSDYFEEPLGTLLARHHRALRKLRALLEEMGVGGLDLGGEGDGP